MMIAEELYTKIGRWNELQAQLVTIKDQEMKLRREIFAACFPAPTEGTNKLELPEGWTMKATYKLNRSLDEAALPAVLAELRKHKVNTEELVSYKPSLSLSAYKKLDPRWVAILDQVVTTTPGAPTLELVAPKS
jgi:hypothetical protein